MRRTLRHVRRFTVLLAVVAVACAAAPAAEPPAVRIQVGVSVGGVPVGGLTAEPARTLLERHFAQPLGFEHAGERWQLRPERLGAAGVDDAVSLALRAHPGARVPLRVTVRERAVRRYVAFLARRWFRPARNSELVGLESLRPAFTPPRAGRRVVRRAMVEAIVRAIETGDRRPLALATAPVAPAVTPDSFGPVVVIRRESKVLALYDGPRLVQSFPVATGLAEYPTPLGSFSIVDMQRDPWWRPPKSEWAKDAEPIPPGPGNPLGTRWMGISVPAVGIHGTPDAASIGYSASHGCIRMRIPDAEWLFTQVEIGTPVVIVAA